MKQRDVIKMLLNNGFSFYKHGGNHDIYIKGKVKIPIPRHKEIKEGLVKTIKKQAGIK